MRSVTSTVFCFLSTLLLTMADTESFVGKWKLIETYDEEFQVVELPTGDFTFNLQPEETDQGDMITVGSLMSTMMMPPEPLFRVETYLSNTLPKMTLVQKQVVDGTTFMTFSGLGKIVCQKVDS